MDKFDKRKTCVMLAEYMIAAQEMIERAETRRDRMIADCLFHMAYTLELLVKLPRDELEGDGERCQKISTTIQRDGSRHT